MMKQLYIIILIIMMGWLSGVKAQWGEKDKKGNWGSGHKKIIWEDVDNDAFRDTIGGQIADSISTLSLSGGSSDADSIRNATVDTSGIFNNAILKYNSSTNAWEIATDATGAGGSAYADSIVHDGRKIIGDSLVTDAEGAARYQPLESTLTDIADGTISENLVNTAFPWADNEVANDITASNYTPLLVSDADNTLTFAGTNANMILNFTASNSSLVLRRNGEDSYGLQIIPSPDGTTESTIYSLNGPLAIGSSAHDITLEGGNLLTTFNGYIDLSPSGTVRIQSLDFPNSTGLEDSIEAYLDLEDLQGDLSPLKLNTTGTPSSSTFLRGDSVWATPAGGGDFNSSDFGDSLLNSFKTGAESGSPASGDTLIAMIGGVQTRIDVGDLPTGSQLTQEQVEDYVGGMVTGNTETGIAVTYEDVDGTIDFTIGDLSGTYETQLNNEAGLYSALSDVTNFLQTGDAIAGDDITDGSVDGSEIDESSLVLTGLIDEPALDVTNSPTDNYLLSYNAVGTNFTWVVSPAGGGSADSSFYRITVDTLAGLTGNTIVLEDTLKGIGSITGLSVVEADSINVDSLVIVDWFSIGGTAVSANGTSLITAANYAAMRTLLDLEAGTDFYPISAADAAFEGELNNEAGLYSALSDVTNFLQTGDALSADDLNDGSTNAAITLTQETNFETAYTISQYNKPTFGAAGDSSILIAVDTLIAGFNHNSFTVDSVVVITQGPTPNFTFQIIHSGSTDLFSSAQTVSSGGVSVFTTFADATLTARNAIYVEIPVVTTKPKTFAIILIGR